jgi:hypothetical protein
MQFFIYSFYSVLDQYFQQRCPKINIEGNRLAGSALDFTFNNIN